MKRPLECIVVGLLASLLAVSPAMSSSPAAWNEFRRKVEAACVAAAAKLVKKPSATIDPWGSESYGLALVRGRSVDSGKPAGVICVYDKRSGAVEIGSTLSLSAGRSR